MYHPLLAASGHNWRRRIGTSCLHLRIDNVVSSVPLAATQLVILLYLLDNNTSFIILASSAVGLAIEFWKVQGLDAIPKHHLQLPGQSRTC